MTHHHVAIIGGGLAGLTCARELEAHGVRCTVLEAADRVGGRVRTDIADGFRIDRGFQVLLTAYPEAQRLLDYDQLRLRPFFPGAIIVHHGRMDTLADPWQRPLTGVVSVLRGTVSPLDGLRMARLRARVGRHSPTDHPKRPELTTRQRLEREGFSSTLINGFFRPFFGGVFLDTDLETSERQLEFVFRMFSRGAIAVPALGMGEIPTQLAAGLHRTEIRTNTPVAAASAHRVELTDGDHIDADAVVIATDADTARSLDAEIDRTRWRSVTCLSFAADRPPIRGPYLVLNGDGDGPVNNLSVTSEVAPEAAPDGRTLISATVIGVADDDAIEIAVRRQLGRWFGDEERSWRLLKIDVIHRALPDQSPPQPGPGAPRLRSGLFVCGDHRHDGSINGAMASGRAAADVVAAKLRQTP
ncbi:MAG: NAD(P)/FAD-dependent oxidoreductase [Thermoanaerobaculales bacterium]|nr:NAD(P)/FAD-dependent oxidoreductase [Thermoanaerobaculales bacterium]